MRTFAVIKETVTHPGYRFFFTPNGVGVEIVDDGFCRLELANSMTLLLRFIKTDLESALC